MNDDRNKFVPEDDESYERRIYEEQKAAQLRSEEYEKQKLQRERELEKKRQEQLRQEKLELMKLKSGVIEDSEIIKEEHEEKRELTGKEKIANFWYHFKIPVIIGTVMLAAVIYIVYDTVSREKPDIYVLSTCNNGLEYRTEQLEDYLERFCPDLNGDGKVKVQIISAPESQDYQIQTSNQAKIITQLQSSDTIIVLTSDDVYDLKSKVDENGNYTEDSYVFADCFKDLREDFPNNEKIDEKGYRLNGKSVSEALEWEDMPDNIILSLRGPTSTLYGKYDEMVENYEVAMEILKKIMEDNS